MRHPQVTLACDSETLEASRSFFWLTDAPEGSYGRVEFGDLIISVPGPLANDLADTLERLAHDLREAMLTVRIADYWNKHAQDAPTPDDVRSELLDAGYFDNDAA